MPTQMPSTGRPAATRSAIIGPAPSSSMPAMHAAYAPTPGTTSPSAAAAAVEIAGHRHVDAGAGHRPLGRAQVARPVVEHHHRSVSDPGSNQATPPAAASAASTPTRPR